MLRYVLAAQALRAASVSPSLYRKLGNRFSGRAKSVERHYVERADANLGFIESLECIRDGMTVLELGTGWVHWEALFSSLFHDVRFILFDVWDNRQFTGFLRYASHLKDNLPRKSRRASALLPQILECQSFDEVYSLLGWIYIVEPSGSLDRIPDGSLDLVISSDVLEHIPPIGLKQLVSDLRRVLRPNGVCAAQIVQEDHLRIYDRSVHPKNYLRYSDLQWNALFNNRVQYINRLQHSDYLKMLSRDFDILADEVVARSEIPFRVADRFSSYSQHDLGAGVTRIAARLRPGRCVSD
jgi:SAM-dependent methyltransferase